MYWIGSWLLYAGSVALLGRGYGDVRLGCVMLGLAQLLAVWSAGLTLLAAGAFPVAPLRWNVPLRIGAATAVWFLAAPFVLPLSVVLSTGSAVAAIMFGWAGIRYLRLTARTRYVGVVSIGAGLLSLCATNTIASGAVLNVPWDAQAFNRLVGFNIIINMSSRSACTCWSSRT